MDHNEAFEHWLTTLPEVTQRLAREFPPGTCFEVKGKVMWVMSYGEDDDMITLTPVDPFEDYGGALVARQPCCAAHLREAKEKQNAE
jgi:hypothetical protein